MTDAPSGAPAAGRKLLQSNSDGITSTVGTQNQTATLDVTTQDNIRVSVIVNVLPQDRNNLTAIVNSAINDGQVRRGLQEAGQFIFLHRLGQSLHPSFPIPQRNVNPSTQLCTPPVFMPFADSNTTGIGNRVSFKAQCICFTSTETLVYRLQQRSIEFAWKPLACLDISA